MSDKIIHRFDKFGDFELSKMEKFIEDKDKTLEEAKKVFEETLIKLEENKNGKV